jgi:hypothetical protein
MNLIKKKFGYANVHLQLILNDVSLEHGKYILLDFS